MSSWSRLSLGELPVAGRVAVSVLLLSVAGGLLAAQAALRAAVEYADGRPGLSVRDVEYRYHGDAARSRLRAAIAPGGVMARYLPPGAGDRRLLRFFADTMLARAEEAAAWDEAAARAAWAEYQRVAPPAADEGTAVGDQGQGARGKGQGQAAGFGLRAADQAGATPTLKPEAWNLKPEGVPHSALRDPQSSPAPLSELPGAWAAGVAGAEPDAATLRRAAAALLREHRFPVPLDAAGRETVDGTVAELVQLSCQERCHRRDAAEAAQLPLDEPDTVVALGGRDHGMSWERLAVFTHYHALGIGMFAFLVMAVFAATGLHGGLKAVLSALLGAAFAADLGGWWLTKWAAWGAWFTYGGGLAFALLLALMIAYCLIELWLIPARVPVGPPADSGAGPAMP